MRRGRGRREWESGVESGAKKEERERGGARWEIIFLLIF